ncbi:rod shape-determining protein MreD [Fructilactobacillus vespulae]|uniref:rod shape-determining protein MreD n=1 Tax=Fructilactobacillus vespulae TaxID=1249630 RepID=UPI0039B6B924
MLKETKIKILFLTGLILSFLLEGTLMNVFSQELASTFPMVPYLTITWLIFFVLFTNKQQQERLYLWTFLVGIVYDTYYIGVIGIYMFIFPIIILITKIILDYLDENIMTSIMIYLIDIIILLLLGCFGGRLSHLVYFSGIHFIAYAFGPTLLLNLIIFLVLYFPLSLLFDKYRQ